jgi:hypothetical protein
MPEERADIGSHGSPGEAKVTPAGRVAEYFYRYWYFIVPLTILLQGCVSHITLPGLYMDAVNPDYMIVRLLNWNSHIYTLALPGTCLFGIFPTIIQMYHGALPYYLGAPVYILFGTGIVGVRVANFVFASIVLMSAAVFLRVFGVRPLFIGSTLAVVALDPGFLFSFRTQFYITLLPIAFVLLSVSIVENADLHLSRKASSVAGLLIGLSVYGYFIYLFLVPAAALHLWRRLWPNPQGRVVFVYWLAGFALGVSPYLIGFALMFAATGGAPGFERFIAAYIGGSHVLGSQLNITQSLKYFFEIASETIGFVGPSTMMLRKTYTPFFAGLKFLMLLAPATAILLMMIPLARKSIGIVLLFGFAAGTCSLFLLFGDRLWLHHAAMILLILYLGLALALEYIAKTTSLDGWANWALALPFLILGLGNAIDRQRVMLDLERTGGVGLASDAIERFAEDSRSNPEPTFAFFPDWGVFMPFEMVTGGQIPLLTDFSPEAALRKLCEGQDALLAIINDKGVDRLAPWIDAVGWGSPEIVVYRQRDNVPVLTSLRWRASAPTHPACVS